MGKEYFLAFCVAFIFFFFIFLINQILLIANSVLISNVDIRTVLHIVVLSVPQFLLFTFPFAALSGSAMVIGDFSSSNELLALRAVGISLKKIFASMIVMSLFFSVITFISADILMPYSSVKYRQIYFNLLNKMPALELKSNTSTNFGNIVISNGDIEGSTINDLLIFDLSDNESKKLISAKKGYLSILDLNNYIYSLDLDNPVIMTTDSADKEKWNLANAEKATFYIDFSKSIPELTASNPSNLSSVDLITRIKKSKINHEASLMQWKRNISAQNIKIASLTNRISNGEDVSINEINNAQYEINNQQNYPIDFYLQYYRAEFFKKFALSIACFFLTLATIPLAYLRFQHGKIIAFGLSTFIAIFYWYLLLFAQFQIFDFVYNPVFLLFAPNMIIFVITLILIKVWRN